jgi:hypothetical protein
MCEEGSMYHAEAIVLARYGRPGQRAMLDDPRVIEYLKARDASPWDALKAVALRLFERAVPAG